ncbi:hypothetical protein CIB84_007988 [Bambusicola thoracicus]|uniref:Origin recognition complex subunit 6 n=1 Tax=Bambusicola thoracicus TaxID=9083 RepID=A0A2P4SVW6_BAMTH|nr:hypothetical protein CIB84_007988 [Bambusicola thoracicus]
MERGAVRELAARLGLGEPRVVRKAEEYLRLSQVKCAGLMAHVTATGLAVMCLELAARCAKHPAGKSSFVKLSGLNRTAYQSSVQALECLLGLNARLGMRDLAVQFCCTEAVKAASEILQRCLKLKVDKAKMLAISGVKKAIFDRLCSQMEKISQQLSKDDIPLAAETSETLQTDLEQGEEEGSEDCDEIPCKQPKTETKQDYEEWKRRILENAAKAQETNSGTVSIVPPCNITTACS